ncbi:MAG TPA: MFS transporter, partial [Ancylobacter sp.]
SAIGFRLVRERLGSDKPTALLGLGLCGLFVMASGLPLPAWGQVALAFLTTSSNILAFITLLAAVSSSVDETERGWALGIANAGVALSVFLAGLMTSLLVFLPTDLFLVLGGVLVLTGIVPGLRLASAPAEAPARA